MRKQSFFTEQFLNECEKQLRILEVEINSGSAFAHPADLSDEEKEVRARFVNRILYMLYLGGRISFDTYCNESYIITT